MKKTIYLSFLLVAFLTCGINNVQAQFIAAEQNYAANSPGVVMVQTAFSATVYVSKVEMIERKFNQLVDSVNRLDTSGSLISAEEKLDIVVRALYNNPLQYFSRTAGYFRQQHRILSSGTGFFISGDGYLVTNTHIIDRDSAYIRRKFILSTYQEVTDANIRALQNAWDMTLSDEQRNLLYNAYSLIYSQVSSMILFDLQREISVQFRIDNSEGLSATRKLPARVVISGRAMPGKDVAVLKVDSVKQLPTLLVSKDSIARIGEEIFVFGYPEPVSSNAYLAKETSSDPTLTAGIVSAVKRSIGGWPVIQMDAVITHGSSGSPVCNNSGQVVGLATFGTLEQQTGSLASGYNFAIPVSIVRQFLDSINVEPAMSKASLTFNDGLTQFYQGYFFKALNKFESVKKLNENYPSLHYYINECERKVGKGEDRESFTQRFVFRVMAVILILGGLYVFYRWQQLKARKTSS